MTELVMTHAEYELLHEDEAAYAQACEMHRQAAHKLRHGGSLDGYESPRAFPCPGGLWKQAGNGPMREVWCDSCSFTTSVRETAAGTDRPVMDW